MRHKLSPSKNAEYPRLIRNLLLVSELMRISQSFRSANIPFMSIKGPILSLLAYGDPYMRKSVDLDFIVHKKDLRRCRRVLLKCGYRFHKTIFSTGETAYRLAKTDKKAKLLVELHWNVAPCFWRGKRNIILNGKKIPTLSTKNTLIWIYMNAAKDGWNPPSHIKDLAAFLSRNFGETT